MKTIFLYPGQGAQYPGMGYDLLEKSNAVKELVAVASEASELDISTLLSELDEEALKSTDKSQVLITAVNLMALTYLRENGIESDGCAGFSLGEYSALVDAGILTVKDVFPLVTMRGQLMEEASRVLDNNDTRQSTEKETPASGGPEPEQPKQDRNATCGMAAVLGLDIETIKHIINELQPCELYLANHNSPQQCVLSGTTKALAAAEKQAKEKGAKRFIRLKVSGPFHSPLMKKAKETFESVLENYGFKDPQKPVYSNVTGQRVFSGIEAKTLCAEQIVSPVQWVTEEKTILSAGFEECLEVGPGKVLCGLWKAVSREIPCIQAGTREQIERIS